MSMVVLEVRSLADSLADIAQGMEHGVSDDTARISFATPELVWQVLNEERWALLKAIGGAKPLSISEVASRVGRDEAAVRGDVEALWQAGILEKVGEREIEFPYDTVKVEFLLRAA